MGGYVIRLHVQDIKPIFEEFVKRGTISKEKFRANTAWRTNEFGFYDLNQNFAQSFKNSDGSFVTTKPQFIQLTNSVDFWKQLDFVKLD